jgi:hypothetical protein
MLDLLNLLKRDLVYCKLLDFGLFSEKLEAIFTSEDFGKWARKKNVKLYQGWDFSLAEYRLTRNNNAPRILHTPHPIAYARLCAHIKSNWKEIVMKLGEVNDYDTRSMVVPKPNNLNNRLISMLSYNKRDDEILLKLDKQFGKRYQVHADIANCYPSIYSHSVTWALVGREEAKKNKTDSSKWYNQFDFAIRAMQRNETIGVPIGPDTSGLISELILSQIDKELSQYDYVRFIDDYTCYCKSKEEVDEFLRDLSRSLEKYHMKLNTKKTKILELPTSINEDWVRNLRFVAGSFLKEKTLNSTDIDRISDFIDLAITLSSENPGDSPLKYMVKVLTRKYYEDQDTLIFVLIRLFRICFVYPYFVDALEDLLAQNSDKINGYIKQLLEVETNALIIEHIKYRRSDVALWCAYLAIRYGFKINDYEKISDLLIEEGDCFASLLMYEYAKENKIKSTKYLALVQTIVDKQDRELEDEWWIYIYQLYIDNHTKIMFKKIKYKDYYDLMRKDKISFLKKMKFVKKPKKSPSSVADSSDSSIKSESI